MGKVRSEGAIIDMSDEMMTPTPDSSAGASERGGAGSAILGYVRDAAGYEQDDEGDRALNSPDDDALEGDDDFDGSSEPDSPGAVPYERFREVNEKAKQYEATQAELAKWDSVLKQFKDQGYTSAEEVTAALKQQAQEAEEASIRSRYEQLIADEAMDVETAQARYDAELATYRAKQLMADLTELRTRDERSSALREYPLAERASGLVDQLIASGMKPKQAAQLIHQQIETLQRSIQSELAVSMAKGREAPAGIGGGSAGSVQGSRDAGRGGGAASTIASLLGITRGRSF